MEQIQYVIGQIQNVDCDSLDQMMKTQIVV